MANMVGKYRRWIDGGNRLIGRAEVVVGETGQQLPPKFIVGDVAQSILDVKTEGDHIGDTTKTVALNISGYDDIILNEDSGLAYLTGRDGWMWKVDLQTGEAEHFVDVPLMHRRCPPASRR